MTDILIVTGSRNWTDELTIEHALCDARPKLVVHGACPTGADKIADDWCKANSVRVERFPADWSRFGTSAGPIRNRQMLSAYPTASVAAFALGGPGTADCIRQAKALGMVVRVYLP